MKSLSIRIALILLITLCGVSMAKADLTHTLELREAPVITLSDFSNARVIENGNAEQVLLDVTLKPSAAQKMAVYSADHLGKTLDWVVDGQVISSPVIRAEIKEGKMQIGPLKRASAEMIAQWIDSK
jgi:preprotein translocase subunit SecD